MVAPTHLRSLQALEVAVRQGSFEAASRVLGITPAAVGQRVKALEDYLGVTLLERGRAGIRAAPGLRSALPHLARAFEALEAAALELELQRAQEIHIAAVSDFAELWLLPRLERFRRDNASVRFCVNGEGDAPGRLGRADCEVSYGPVPEGGNLDLLFRDYVLPVTSPVNAARTAMIPAEDRLEGFPLLHLDFYKDDPAGLSWPHWVASHAVRRTAPERGMRFQRITAALDAMGANAGVGLCGLALIAERVQAGSVALPFPVDMGRWSEHGFVAGFRSDSEGRLHLRRFRRWLAEEAAATDAWLRVAAVGV